MHGILEEVGVDFLESVGLAMHLHLEDFGEGALAYEFGLLPLVGQAHQSIINNSPFIIVFITRAKTKCRIDFQEDHLLLIFFILMTLRMLLSVCKYN